MSETKNSIKSQFVLNGHLSVKDLSEFVFHRKSIDKIQIEKRLWNQIENSFRTIQQLIDQGVPIYGVTTGFGESCTRYVQREDADRLQVNLIEYLSCGLGKTIPVEAARAMFLIRLNSLCQGYSGVSPELIERMILLLEHDILPSVPCEGSLGASGDLVPLAYLGQTIQGHGEAFYQGALHSTGSVLEKLNLGRYKLKAKEGLAIVNGTSTMAGVMHYNLTLMESIIELSQIATAWQCLLLGGRLEAFGVFINEVAKTNPGQKKAASMIRALLQAEKYSPPRGQDIKVAETFTSEFIQDPYSLRCVPQILGPIIENLEQSWVSLEHEINSVTDNPVVDIEGRLEMGGNFYGGYLCQAMDFTKINLAHVADLVDRQVLMIVSEKFSRGLPANLINRNGIKSGDQHLHHGLKGVHQTVGALTSEVIQRAIPSGIFSRSSESHNQDKVSLGMSAAMSCLEMIEGVYKILSMQFVCLAQALDLKEIRLQGQESQNIYQLVRKHVAFLDGDRSLGREIVSLTAAFTGRALEPNGIRENAKI